jgi:nitroimidazol reductase NimA-like FMN-containing flavoprotein (pyridoxamine 5'-phosphate oxidase superfamily)
MTARSTEQRRRDTLARLENDVDLWMATADGGTPYLVPLSFRWDGATLLVSTPASSPTGRNLASGGKVRVALGVTRDVVLVEGDVAVVEPDAGEADAFATKAGFDPRESRGYLYFRVAPRRIQAWREVDELAGRDLMRDGVWVDT